MLQVFRKSWNYIGPAAELTKVGDYVTGYAGNVPVVVVRNDKGLAAFVNVCRHRRHLVMKGRGNATLMQCGYHAWTYDLAGGLRRAPRSAAEPGFRLEDFPLLPIRRRERSGPSCSSTSMLNAPAGEGLLIGPILDIIAQERRRRSTPIHAAQPRRLAGARQLEGDAGELSRMLPLRRRPSWLQRRRSTCAPDVYTLALARLVLQPGLAVCGRRRSKARPRSSSTTCAARWRSRSITSCGRTSPSTSIRASPTCRSMSGCPTARTRPAASPSSISDQGVDEGFAEALIAFNKQVAQEDDDLTDAVQRGLVGSLPERGTVPHQERAVGDPVPEDDRAGAERQSLVIPSAAREL